MIHDLGLVLNGVVVGSILTMLLEAFVWPMVVRHRHRRHPRAGDRRQ